MSEEYVKLDDVIDLLDDFGDLEYISEREEAEEKLRKLPTVELPQWHDLSKNPEDLPPHNTLVLVVVGRFYDIAWLDSYDNFRLSRNNNIINITKWCEIPKENVEKNYHFIRKGEDMLINKNCSTENHVKFISYTGKYPNLCRGILTLMIDGNEVKFGHDYTKYGAWKTDGNYSEFWSSGGSCGFNGSYSDSYCCSGEWQIDVEAIPEQYRQYAVEIDEVFNENVEYGCCGGCL